MSTAEAALLVALVALAAAAAIGVVAIRARRASERRLRNGLLEVGGRMDGLAQELAAAVEQVREDALRARIVESLGQALDLDEVLARCAEAAAALHGVTGAVADVSVDGARLTASAGLAVDPSLPPSATSGPSGDPPDGASVRAIGISYHYRARTDRDLVRSAIAVPLESEGRLLGYLTVFGQGEEPPVTGNDFSALEAIARHAGPAIVNARRREAPRPRAEADSLTGLGTRQALHETLALEVARAHRHARPLAVCVVDLDDFGQANERLGQTVGDGILVEVAARLGETIRPEDIAYRSGGDAFAVIMPGARRIDGEALYARLQGSLGRPAGSLPPGLAVSAGIAELKPDDDGVSLYERAERALQRAKQAGKGTAA